MRPENLILIVVGACLLIFAFAIPGPQPVVCFAGGVLLGWGITAHFRQ